MGKRWSSIDGDGETGLRREAQAIISLTLAIATFF